MWAAELRRRSVSQESAVPWGYGSLPGRRITGTAGERSRTGCSLLLPETRRLQPYFIEAFFIEAFRKLGGKIHKREKGRYEITFVPFVVRNRDMQIGFGKAVMNKYERVCFEKTQCNIPGRVPASLICPGHPLLEATASIIRERGADSLKRGTIFVDVFSSEFFYYRIFSYFFGCCVL